MSSFVKASGGITSNSADPDLPSPDDAPMGVVQCMATNPGMPGGWGILLNLPGSNSEDKQIYFSSIRNNPPSVRVRAKYKNKYGSWQRLAAVDDLSNYVPLSTYQALEARVQALEAKLANQ